MSKVPSDLRYAKTHEWVRIAGDYATVGITDHAQEDQGVVYFSYCIRVKRWLVWEFFLQEYHKNHSPPINRLCKTRNQLLNHQRWLIHKVLRKLEFIFQHFRYGKNNGDVFMRCQHQIPGFQTLVHSVTKLLQCSDRNLIHPC